MGRYLPTAPGWYRNPDDPRSLRYWDGRVWTSRARPRPPWSSRTDPFDLAFDEADRSVEGPVHPHELREPVASGAWSREWLSWRPRQVGPAWHRGPGQHSARPARPLRLQPPAKLGPARRPLLAFVCLVVVAVGVVVSSVAFISPYETTGIVRASDQVADARFMAQANKDCVATLPKYRGVLVVGNDGPKIAAAARQVDLMRLELASIRTSPDIRGPLDAWLGTLQQFTADQSRYAAIIGPAARASHGRLVARALGPVAKAAAAGVHRQATELAEHADVFSNDLQLPACRLEPAPAA
jgi:hypothetical protein